MASRDPHFEAWHKNVKGGFAAAWLTKPDSCRLLVMVDECLKRINQTWSALGLRTEIHMNLGWHIAKQSGCLAFPH